MTKPNDVQGSLAGRLLLAMPDMPDPRFVRSAILLCVHDEGGALGIALHEPAHGVGLHALLSSFDIAAGQVGDEIVLAGGPVEPRRGFVLHSRDWSTADSHAVAPDIALTGSIEILSAIARGEGPRDYLVALGYAGWAAGQLERELAAPGWYVATADARRLFAMAPHERWAGAFALEGIDPAMLASSSGHA
jgi:putative transcriptional regulator